MRCSPQSARESVYGVKGLSKDIQVRSGLRTDPEITRDVVHALGVNITLSENRMIVTVKDAYVTLDVSLMIDEALKRNAETGAPA